MITTIFFDLDNTLVDREETMTLFLKAQYARFEDQLAATRQDYVRQVLVDQKGGYEDKYTAYENALIALVCDATLAEPLMSDFKERYGTQAVAFPGVPETLTNLKLSYKLGLITNGRSLGQRRKIGAVGIASLFDTIVVSGEVEWKKPDPRIFEYALAQVSSKPQETAFVGDNPQADIEPAATLGMLPIWVSNKNFESPRCNHHSIQGMGEIGGLIKKINEG